MSDMQNAELHLKNEIEVLKKNLKDLDEKNAELNAKLFRMRQLYNNTTIGLYQTTPEGKVLLSNPPLVKMLGYESLEEMQKHNLEDNQLINKSDRQIFKNRIEKEGIIVGHETSWLKKNGEKIYIRESARAIKDNKGQTIFYEGTIEDISIQKIREIELAQSEEKYRKLVELLPSGVVIHKDGKIIFANDYTANVIKVKSKEELVNQPILKYIHPDYHKLVQSRLSKALKGKTKLAVAEEVFVTEKGESFYVTVSTVTYSFDNELYFLTVFSDITDRKQTEKEIKLSELTYRGMLNSISEAIFIQNPDGSFLDVNKAAELMYAYEHNFFIAKSPQELSAENKNDLVEINKKIELAYKGNHQMFEFWGKKSDGTVFPTEVSLVDGIYFEKKVVIAVVRDITERMQNKVKIIDSERKYRELFDFAVGGILHGSPEGIIIEANDYMCKIMGRQKEDIIGKHITDGFFTKESLERSPFLFDKLKLGMIIVNEREISRPDGQIVQVEMHTKMMPDKSYQSFYHDITDRKNAELQIIKEKEIAQINFANLTSIIETTLDNIWAINKCYEIIYTNQVFKNSFFETFNVMLDPGTNVVNCLPDFMKNDWKEKYDTVFENNRVNFEQEIPYNDRIIYVQVSLNPIIKDNKVIGASCFGTDITSQKLAQQELIHARDTAQMLNLHKEALLKAMPDLVFTFNNEGDIIDFYSNSNTNLITKSDIYINKKIDAVLQKDVAETTKLNIDKVIKTQKNRNFTYQTIVNDEIMHFDARMVYLNEENVLAVVRDITERMELIEDLKKSRQKAEESDRLKTAFLANMSHEIRTPMNGILGFTDLLKDDVTQEEKYEYIEIIENSCNQLLFILNDIIEVSKIEAGIITKNTETFLINEFFVNTFNELKGLVPKNKNIDFKLAENEYNKQIIGHTDPIKLKQILANFIINAFKFTEEGFVEIGYELINDSTIEFFVKDSGIGIPPEHISSVFDRFVQVQNKFSAKNSGSGLGLSICKAYGELLGGEIKAESQEYKGSCFYFKVPLISY